ncbi:PilZ domain-containing protein [Sphingomonas sp.]|uniref:PilZ domain-containing protein n=1 Tax=Sphingomonas sp. TaxID=28214 RepID=UPI0035BC74D6
MAVTARLYRDLRGSLRHSVAMESTLRDQSRRPFDVVIEDLSATGVRVPAAAELDAGALITLGIPGVGMCNARVARVDDGGYGCEFLYPLSPDELAEALVALPAEPVPLPLPRPDAAQVAEGNADTLPGGVRIAIILALAAVGWTASYLALHPPF